MSELILKSYKKKDVDAFLLELNAEHLRALTQKDDEIKRLFSQSEHYREESETKDALLAEAEEKHKAELENKQRELDTLNARIGEKISAAEKAASDILEQANKEKEEIRAKAQSDAESYVEGVKKQAEAVLAKVEKQSRTCIEGQRRAEQTIALLNRQLDDTVSLLNELAPDPAESE